MNTAYRLPEASVICVTGKEAMKVLNGLCTAKLLDLAAGQATEAMFTDDRGRVLAHAMVALESAETGNAWVVGFFDAAALAAHVDRFIFREDAAPKDVSAKFCIWLVDGPSPVALAHSQASITDQDFGPVHLADGVSGLWHCRWPVTSSQSQGCLIPREAESQWLDFLSANHCSIGTDTDWQSRRIAHFWPLKSTEITERTLPQELDRDAAAISFTKGCYLGQETVARLDAMGEVQRKLCLVQLDGSAPQAASKLVSDGKEVGVLTSVASEQVDGKAFALAYMKRGWMKPGSRFTILASETAESEASGQVISHP